MSIAAIILAAGGSSRLGEPKQLLRDCNGETLVHMVARDAYNAGCRPVCVVIGATGDQVRAAVADLDVRVVENAHWFHGLSTSIRCGVTALVESNSLSPQHIEGAETEVTDAGGDAGMGISTQFTSLRAVSGVLLLTCDMPSVGQSHIQLLMTEFNKATLPVASSYGDSGGIPAVFPVTAFAALQALEADKGAKTLLAESGARLIALEGGAFDLDTPADVAMWRAAESRLTR